MFNRIFKNLCLYTICFVFSIYLHRGSISFDSGYDLYLGAFLLSWGIASLLSRKFKFKGEILLLDRLYTYTISFFLMLGILAIIFYYFNLMGISRTILISSLLIAYTAEVSYLLYTKKERLRIKNINLTYSGMAFLFEVNLYELISFTVCYFISKVSFPGFNITGLFISLSLSWFTGSFLGHHFSLIKIKSNYPEFIWQYIKTYIIIMALALFSAFINQLEPGTVKYIFYGVFLYSLFSFIGATIYYYIKRHRSLVLNLAGFPFKGEFGDILLNERIQDIENYRSDFAYNDAEILQKQLKNLSLKRYPQIYEFVNKCLDLNSFDSAYSLILKSNSVISVDFLPDSTLQLLINLQKLNQIHNINEYLTEINQKLVKKGVFIGNFETVYLRHAWFLESYPYYLAQLFYFFDFLWNRLFSKAISLKMIYKAVMGSTNKALSLAEGLGRLYYSGFEILHLKLINNSMFFIAKKNGSLSQDSLPSTGILFKMKRYGKDDKEIYIYKLRTMHPYAQYLQEFVYDRFKLQEGGKLSNDFRITSWGRILRKLWIDELPMIYNWLRGDMKLVGCRPLSQHYYSLYPEKLRQKRKRYKPGLIPPFYADNPKTFTEILRSEEIYLDMYERNPIRTDIKYFSKCITNILFKGARSS